MVQLINEVLAVKSLCSWFTGAIRIVAGCQKRLITSEPNMVKNLV